jgi:hypothetical protein
MNEKKRKRHNDEKLGELYPTFRDKIRLILTELESEGFRPRIQEAWRSEKDQLKAFNSHFSQVKYGFHNVTASDGTKEALAVDMEDDSLVNKLPVDYDEKEFRLRLTAAVQRQGLVSGIFWGLQKSGPEDESFARAAIAAIVNAITNEDWKARIDNWGWDPKHIQPPDMTPEDARKGMRPT